MAKDAPAADPVSSETSLATRGLGGLLATRGRKIAAIVGAAVLAGIGGGIATWLLTAAETTTKRVFAGAASKALVLRVAAPGTFWSNHPYAPYYVVPYSRFSHGPNGISKGDLSAMSEAEKNDIGIDFAWMRAHGGVAGSPQVVRLELRGTTEEPVTVTAIRALVVERSAPVRGWYVAAPGCGAVPVRSADINLDSPNAPVKMIDPQTGKRILAVSVTRTDTEQIELHAYTKKAVAWRARLFYSDAKGDGSMIIDDAGKPFRVTSEDPSDGYRAAGFDNNPGFTREHQWDRRGLGAC